MMQNRLLTIGRQLTLARHLQSALELSKTWQHACKGRGRRVKEESERESQRRRQVPGTKYSVVVFLIVIQLRHCRRSSVVWTWIELSGVVEFVEFQSSVVVSTKREVISPYRKKKGTRFYVKIWKYTKKSLIRPTNILLWLFLELIKLFSRYYYRNFQARAVYK